jgi:hypothetical protein
MKTRPEYRLCYMFYELENGFKRWDNEINE